VACGAGARSPWPHSEPCRSSASAGAQLPLAATLASCPSQAARPLNPGAVPSAALAAAASASRCWCAAAGSGAPMLAAGRAACQGGAGAPRNQAPGHGCCAGAGIGSRLRPTNSGERSIGGSRRITLSTCATHFHLPHGIVFSAPANRLPVHQQRQPGRMRLPWQNAYKRASRSRRVVRLSCWLPCSVNRSPSHRLRRLLQQLAALLGSRSAARCAQVRAWCS